VLLAWFKLRKRNLGPILDANGWAVNARAKINIPFGASLTAAARLPENAERSLADPFAEKRRPWIGYLILIALVVALLVLWRLLGG
jgi:ferric-dicitrate binding protein FerR (iron transport regulator)